MVKWHQGVESVFIQIYKQGWIIPPDISVDVTIQFDRATPWIGKATQASSGTGIEMRVPDNRLEAFLDELRLSNGMIISFPTGTETPWVANMTGSYRASLGMGACYSRYNAPQVQSQPYGAAPPQSSQPYSTTTPQPNPAPNTPARITHGYQAI